MSCKNVFYVCTNVFYVRMQTKQISRNDNKIDWKLKNWKIYIEIWIAKYIKTDQMDGLPISESLTKWFLFIHGFDKHNNIQQVELYIRTNTQIK